MKECRVIISLLVLLLGCNVVYCQVKPKTTEWIKVSEDETVTISYNPNITTNKDGNLRPFIIHLNGKIISHG